MSADVPRQKTESCSGVRLGQIPESGRVIRRTRVVASHERIYLPRAFLIAAIAASRPSFFAMALYLARLAFGICRM